MDIKTMMNELVEEEIIKLEQNGEKVRLKTLTKKRVQHTLIFGVIFLLLICANYLFIAFIDMMIYFILMYKTTNAGIITNLAKKSPDTPIADIIKGDMK